MKNQVITNRTPNTIRVFGELKKIERFGVEEENRLIEKYQRTGCIISRNKVIENNLLFAATRAKMATRHNISTMSFTDLLSVATEGMIYALDKFDVSQGNKFISYAVLWIRQRTMEYIQTKSRTIKQHSHSATIYKAMDKVREEGKEVTADNVFDWIHSTSTMNHKKKFSLHLIQAVLDTMIMESLDKPLGFNKDDNSSKTYLDSQKDTRYMPDAKLDEESKKYDILKYLEYLKPREKEIITYKFGLEDGIPRKLGDIGDRVGLTRERVRQIEDVAMKKLRKYMTKGSTIQAKLFA